MLYTVVYFHIGELPLSQMMRTRLYKMSRWLTEHVDASHGLLECMLSEGAINRRHHEAIMAKATDSDKNMELIEIVSRRSYRTLDCFLSGLRKTGQDYVACQLEEGQTLHFISN